MHFSYLTTSLHTSPEITSYTRYRKLCTLILRESIFFTHGQGNHTKKYQKEIDEAILQNDVPFLKNLCLSCSGIFVWNGLEYLLIIFPDLIGKSQEVYAALHEVEKYVTAGSPVYEGESIRVKISVDVSDTSWPKKKLTKKKKCKWYNLTHTRIWYVHPHIFYFILRQLHTFLNFS